MTDGEKLELREQINKDIKSLQGDIGTLRKQVDPVAPDVAIGRLSRMDAIGEKSVKEALLRSTEAKVFQLENTVKNLDEPDFGKCKICKNDIPLARIMAVPESGKCINCA
ncbi:MAG: TraR/DksA family transcriptional regulator [Leptospirales bacterium]